MSGCRAELLYVTRGESEGSGPVVAISGNEGMIVIDVVPDGGSGYSVSFKRSNCWPLICAILKSWWKSRP